MIPRGFALVFDDLAAHGWAWRAWSVREREPQATATVLMAVRLVEGTGDEAHVFAVWVSGSWATGAYRHPDDPVPVAVGSRALRPVLRGEAVPRWTRPDLNAPRAGSKVPRQDEGTPAHERWSPDIEARVSAGMNQGRGPAG